LATLFFCGLLQPNTEAETCTDSPHSTSQNDPEFLHFVITEELQKKKKKNNTNFKKTNKKKKKKRSSHFQTTN